MFGNENAVNCDCTGAGKTGAGGGVGAAGIQRQENMVWRAFTAVGGDAFTRTRIRALFPVRRPGNSKASRFLVYSGGEDQVVFDAPPPTGGTG